MHRTTIDDCKIIELPKIHNRAGNITPIQEFETEVINGMENALKSKYLKAVIIELNNSGKRYGYKELYLI